MKMPWISNRAAMLLGIAMACFPTVGEAVALPYLSATQTQKSMWAQAEGLADRLIEERRKLDGLLSEADKLRFISEDLRDLQLYPSTATRLTREDDIELDRAIEKLEKSTDKTRDAVLALEAPLADAVFITGEMVNENLNRDMLDLLQGDNVSRVAQLIALQKEMDSRWDAAAALLEKYRKRSGAVTEVEKRKNLEDDFFRVLQSSVGLSSDRFYQAYHAFKDALAKRGGQKEWELMAKVDLGRLQKRMSGRGIDRVRQDLERLKERFNGKMPIGMIDFTLATSCMANGKPLQAADAFAAVGSGSKMYAESRLGVLQAYFSALEDDSVATAYARFVREGSITASHSGSARYLAVQSLYALRRDTVLEQVALQSPLAEPWHDKTMLVYGRSLVRSGRHPEARTLFGKLSGDPDASEYVRNQAQMALAHLNFEDRFHEAALKGYREMLEKDGYQAEALYGMVWSNIRLGDLDAAEFILKKLISQYPDNPWAMEGFMVLVRKMIVKAREEWNWQEQFTRQMNKLAELSMKLNGPSPGLTAESRQQLMQRIDSARATLARQKPMPAQKIANLYQQALGLCDFLESRYQSGEYSEKTFLTDREKVLSRLRTAAKRFGNDSTFSNLNKSDSRRLILEKLFEARALALDIHLLHRNWLSDWMKQWQLALREEMDSLPNTAEGAAKRADLEKQSRRLADEIGERIAAKSEDILNRIGKLGEDPNSATIQDWLHFQRGYLLYLREEDNLRRWMAVKRWVRGAGSDGVDVLDDEPEVDYRSYEEPWHDLLRRYPKSAWAPAALYYLGYSMTSRGEGDRGLAYFEELANRHPQSTYAQQALIFVGEHYFSENQLDKAEAAYDKVLDFPESRYFDQALYKLAWTRYRKNSYKSAISSFSYILEESLRKNGGKKGVLAGEALQYTALSIAEADTSGEGGWNEGVQFADRFGNAKVGAELLHKMSLIYLQQGRLERAKRALESLMKVYPDYEKGPEVLMDLAQAYDKGQDFEQGANLREKVFRTYLPGTERYRSIESPSRRMELDTLIENACAYVSRHHLFEAQKLAADSVGPNRELRDQHYRIALSVLSAWKAAYPKDSRGAKNLYQQAEIHFALKEFAHAAKSYIQVSRMDKGALKQMAAYNAIVAAQELQRETAKTNGENRESNP